MIGIRAEIQLAAVAAAVIFLFLFLFPQAAPADDMTDKLQAAVKELTAKLPQGGSGLRIDYCPCTLAQGEFDQKTKEITDELLSLMSGRFVMSSLGDRAQVMFRNEGGEMAFVQEWANMKPQDINTQPADALLLCQVARSKKGGLPVTQVTIKVILRGGERTVYVTTSWGKAEESF